MDWSWAPLQTATLVGRYVRVMQHHIERGSEAPAPPSVPDSTSMTVAYAGNTQTVTDTVGNRTVYD
ncbi:MAG: hypothetical protein JWN04_3238 [Myxococcaceae bacterium]|nr:hypothetical protein [Myxococcaceae bacterium]